MPGSILNADINFPHFTGTESTEDKFNILTDYLYMLYEQLRYSMANIGVENFNDEGLKDIIKLAAKDIDITGVVTFHDLETEGATIINGANITTGTISADRLSLTGAITWGDLTSEAQQRVDAGKGDPNPGYIKSTYIDATTVSAPLIRANNFDVIVGQNAHFGSYRIFPSGSQQTPAFRITWYDDSVYDSPTTVIDMPWSGDMFISATNLRLDNVSSFSMVDGNMYGTRLPTGVQGDLYFLI